MKKILILSLVIFMISCSKKNLQSDYPDEKYVAVKYDTTPLDSFSAGATSINIERQIKMSSLKYQDSLKQVLVKQEEERKLKEQQDKLKKDAEKALEKDKAKEENKPETKPTETPKPTENQTTTQETKPVVNQ